ncbi:MAG: carnitine dehydratase [Blastopirellula sp.]|nr:MAG: carnitine dehydratase [Blastopirellula sp.]
MGPLEGVRIVEFAGIGPGPFAGMMLADMGAEILRIDRQLAPDAIVPDPKGDILSRGRKSIILDLKNPASVEVALRLIGQADVLIEGFRPGVMERLGLGPDIALERNPALVYGRMTGWGQTGPLAQAAGHDINYISLCGALWATGEADRPPVPALNLLGDFGGGAMFLAFGIVSALLKARATGQGDVVDAAICDGTASFMGFIQSLAARGRWQNVRASNRLDGAAPFYGVYACSDGKWISVAPLEPQFFDLLLRLLDLVPDDFPDRFNSENWPTQRRKFAEVFATKSRAEWCEILEGTDVCFAPVLDMEEALTHPHNQARHIFDQTDGFVQPAPAPRFQNSPTEMPSRAPSLGQDNETALTEWGFGDAELQDLLASGVVAWIISK